jgi:HlyD family secretion protein
MSKKTLILIVVIVAIVGAGVAWWLLSKPKLPPGFAGGNGRLEMQQYDVAAKWPGRLTKVLVDEGDTVDKAQIVATVDTEPLEAQLRASEAKIKQAEDELRTAQARIQAKQAELAYNQQEYARSKQLVARGAVSVQEAELDRAKADASRADLVGAQAQASAAQSAIESATADSERLKAEIADYTLRAPLRARVETRNAQPGEVLGPGGKVLTLDDLSDVYMYVFLPTDTVGKVALNSEARIVLDAIPQYPIRAFVSFISPNAQFTPKTVETAQERHNLTFRVKLQIPKDRLREFEPLVKAGVPGMGYVRLDQNLDWPAQLQWKDPRNAPWWKNTGAASPTADAGNPTADTGK